jgi:hypothetical protein
MPASCIDHMPKRPKRSVVVQPHRRGGSVVVHSTLGWGNSISRTGRYELGIQQHDFPVPLPCICVPNERAAASSSPQCDTVYVNPSPVR